MSRIRPFVLPFRLYFFYSYSLIVTASSCFDVIKIHWIFKDWWHF